jgi:hypothetical protein
MFIQFSENLSPHEEGFFQFRIVSFPIVSLRIDMPQAGLPCKSGKVLLRKRLYKFFEIFNLLNKFFIVKIKTRMPPPGIRINRLAAIRAAFAFPPA